MSSEIKNNPCTVQDSEEESPLEKWINSLGGKTRVAKLLGVDSSTLWRYQEGQQKTPKWLDMVIRYSNEMEEIKSLNRKLKRENQRLRSK